MLGPTMLRAFATLSTQIYLSGEQLKVVYQVGVPRRVELWSCGALKLHKPNPIPNPKSQQLAQGLHKLEQVLA